MLPEDSEEDGLAHVHHHHDSSSEGRIGVAFFLNLAFAVFELVGGLWTNSMAVLSDALHDFGDSIALGLTWHFTRLSKRRGDEIFTFGYRRFTLLGALVMSVVLFAGGLVVIFESIPRLLAPQSTDARGMLLLAGVGILINGIAALRMHGSRNLGERLVTWHFVEDILGWVAVLVAGLVMMVRDIPILDPALSILITLYVMWNVGRRLKETLVILLQGVPEGLDVASLERVMRSVEGVCDVHHTHLWSQDGEHHVVTTHVVTDVADSYMAVSRLRERLKEELRTLGISHATIEMEHVDGPTCSDRPAGGHCGDLLPEEPDHGG